MKKIVISFLSVIVALCTVISFSACGSQISTAHKLTDLYQNGELTKEDIKNIAALRVGYVAIVESEEQKTEDYIKVEFKPTVPEPLTDDDKQSIERCFESNLDYKISNFKILKYYGNYNGYTIVEISFDSDDVASATVVYPLIVSGIYLGYVAADVSSVIALKIE